MLYIFTYSYNLVCFGFAGMHCLAGDEGYAQNPRQFSPEKLNSLLVHNLHV